MMIYAIHAPEAEKLEQVKVEMQELGTPTIHVVDCGDHYMALEGSHRIAAAFDLGITPELIIYDQDEALDIEGFDWYDSGNWADTTYAAGEVAGELYSRQARAYRFDD